MTHRGCSSHLLTNISFPTLDLVICLCSVIWDELLMFVFWYYRNFLPSLLNLLFLTRTIYTWFQFHFFCHLSGAKTSMWHVIFQPSCQLSARHTMKTIFEILYDLYWQTCCEKSQFPERHKKTCILLYNYELPKYLSNFKTFTAITVSIIWNSETIWYQEHQQPLKISVYSACAYSSVVVLGALNDFSVYFFVDFTPMFY